MEHFPLRGNSNNKTREIRLILIDKVTLIIRLERLD